MHTTRRARLKLKMVVAVAGALAFCAPVWSDVRIGGSSAGAEKMCYCDCDAMAGSPMCTHMCELAKYENRSWATSCHKKADADPTQPSTTPSSHSNKDNHVQQARQ